MDQIEPYRQIVQLQSEIVKISRRNRQLRERCEELERALSEGMPETTHDQNQTMAADPLIQEGLLLRLRVWVSKVLNACRSFRWLRV